MEPTHPTTAELLAEHTFLADLCPPPSVPAPPLPLINVLTKQDGQYGDDCSPCYDIGLVLGSSTPAVARRWVYLAEPELLTHVGKSTFLEYLRPAGEHDMSYVQSGELCLPYESRSFLAPGTPRWKLLQAVAQLLVHQPEEDQSAHLARCKNWDAWAAGNIRKKHGVAILLLWQMIMALKEATTDACLAPLPILCVAADSSASVELRDGDVESQEVAASEEEMLIETVHRIRLREPQLPAQDVWTQMTVAGIECTLSDVKRALNKAVKRNAKGYWPPSSASVSGDSASAASTTLALPADARREQGSKGQASKARGKQRSAEEDRAIADAVGIHDAQMATWMRTNGVQTPTAHEAARLRLLADRLQRYKREGNVDAAVETWLKIELDEGAHPTPQERKRARARMEMFFKGEPSLAPLEDLLAHGR
jgi:hypothetical protein